MNQKGGYLGHGLHQTAPAAISNQLLARRKQINTLQIFNENVTEVRHGVEYRINFHTALVPLTMVIVLPPEFPLHSRPLIKIFASTAELFQAHNSGISHPWLNPENLVVGSPGLNAFGAHSDLGRVVQAIRREFERNPPTILNQSDLSLKCDMLPTTQPDMPNHQSQTATASSQQLSIPEIERLSREELKEIQDDPKAFKVFFRSLDLSMLSPIEKRASDLKASIQTTVAANKEASEQLVSKREAMIAKTEELASAKERCGDVGSKLRSASASLTKSAVCDKLRNASHSDESESERFAEEFLSGDRRLDDFLANYLPIRTRHHLRKAKSEKM